MKLIWLIILLVAIGCADDSPNSIEPVEEDVEEDVVVSNVATLVDTLPVKWRGCRIRPTRSTLLR